jgi:hypothetical protein
MILKFKMFENLSPEDLLNSVETQRLLRDGFGEDSDYWVEQFHSKSCNHKDGLYYRVDGAGGGYAGVGKGLYLGRDKEAIRNMYGIENEDKSLDTYYGDGIRWLDLSDYGEKRNFEKKYGQLLNSETIPDVVMNLGFDGIRYYDPFTTGEEFVLFNTSKVRRIKREKVLKK